MTLLGEIVVRSISCEAVWVRNAYSSFGADLRESRVCPPLSALVKRESAVDTSWVPGAKS